MLPQATPILGLHKIKLFADNIWTGTAKKMVQPKLTRMAAESSFDNTLVAGMAEEK